MMSEHQSDRDSRRDRSRKERPSFVWPIILIVVGAIFLLNNLGIFGDQLWDNVWQLWPFIFIAIGLDSLFRRNEIAGPIFMIGLGSVLLLSSVGILGWGAWDVLWRFWPLLLVAIGIEIMIGRRSLWISILAVIVMIAILGGVLWIYGVAPVDGDQLAGESISQPLGDITEAHVSIEPAVGELVVSGLIDSNDLINGEVGTGENRKVYVDFSTSGTIGYLSLDSRSMANFPGSRPWEWDLGLTNRIPLDVEVSMGAGEMDIDLAGLTLLDLNVSQGVGDMMVSLAPEGDYYADISQAIGTVEIKVPKEAGIRLEVSRAISSLDVPADFYRRGDYYYSPNYDDAEYQIDVEINQAIGSIEVSYGQ